MRSNGLLGSNATKITGNSPVPAFVLPRAADGHLERTSAVSQVITLVPLNLEAIRLMGPQKHPEAEVLQRRLSPAALLLLIL